MKKRLFLLTLLVAVPLIFAGCNKKEDPPLPDPSVSCTTDQECDAGQSCVGGSCVSPAAPAACTGNGDCSDGYVCEDGSCVVGGDEGDCTSALDCDPGEICQNGSCVIGGGGGATSTKITEVFLEFEIPDSLDHTDSPDTTNDILITACPTTDFAGCPIFHVISSTGNIRSTRTDWRGTITFGGGYFSSGDSTSVKFTHTGGGVEESELRNIMIKATGNDMLCVEGLRVTFNANDVFGSSTLKKCISAEISDLRVFPAGGYRASGNHISITAE